jgi:glycogen operon protein
MILMGDEVRRTQNGNNNDYCHDDESNWFDWTLLEKHADVLRFVRLLTAQRSKRPAEHERKRLTLSQVIANARKAWHGTTLNQADWGDWSRSVALNVEMRQLKLRVHLIFNAYEGALDFELPPLDGAPGNAWRRWIDTSLESPNDITCVCEAVPVSGSAYRVGPRSVVVLIADSERALS